MSGHLEQFIGYLVHRKNTEWQPTQPANDPTDIDQLLKLHEAYEEQQRGIQRVNDILERFQVIERLEAIRINAWDRLGAIEPIPNGFLLSHKHPLAVRLYSVQSNLLSGQPVIPVEQRSADAWFVRGERGRKLLKAFLEDGEDYMSDMNLFREAALYRRPWYITEGTLDSSLAISVRQHNSEATHLVHGRSQDLCLSVFMPNYVPREDMHGGRDCFNAIGCVNPDGYVENLDELLKRHIDSIAGNRKPQVWEAGERLLIKQIKQLDAAVVPPPSKNLPDLRANFDLWPSSLFVAHYFYNWTVTRVLKKEYVPDDEEQFIRDIIDENIPKYISGWGNLIIGEPPK